MATRKNKVEIYTDRKKEYRWRLRGLNGKIIDAATEGFKTRSSCIGNLNTTAKAFQNFEIVEVKAKKKVTKKKATKAKKKTTAKKATKKKTTAKKKTAKPNLRSIPGGKAA